MANHKKKRYEFEVHIEYAPLPPELYPAWRFGINKLFEFLEERERFHELQKLNHVDNGSKVEMLWFDI